MIRTPTRKTLTIEALLIFGALPLAISLMKPHGWMYLLLWVAAVVSWRALKREGYHLQTEWNAAALTRANLTRIVRRFALCALSMLFFTWWMIPGHLFSLPRDRPGVWVMVMILYPLLSVVPQEIIFRSYFLKRFAPLFPSPFQGESQGKGPLRIASAIAFGWVHIILQNWVAVAFSAVGGYFFADTYTKTKSLACACLEHALYGCYLFTIGMGYYFYHGQAVR